MTALCGGGSSAPLPLTEPLINLTAAGAATLAAAYGFPELEPVIALAAASLGLVVADYCSKDPPPDPGLTAVDVANALDVMNPGLAIPAIAKVQQWFMSRYWFDVCQCLTVATPPPPALSDPGVGIATNPGAGSGLNAGPCWTITTAATLPVIQQFGHVFVAPWLPSGPGSLISSGVPQPPQVCLPPPGTVTASWSMQHLGSTHPNTMSLHRFQAGGISSGVFLMANSTIAGVQSGTATLNLDAAVKYLGISVDSNPAFDGDWSASWNGTFSLQCSGTPSNTLVAPCCPPDPLIDAKLDLIYSLVLNLYNRNPGSSAYRLGTRHSGLRGSGTLPVSELVGVLVDITTTRDGVVLAGLPPYHFDQGWLSCATPDGFIDEKRLTRTSQLWMPSLFRLADTFGYVLFDGVVADVTELLPA